MLIEQAIYGAQDAGGYRFLARSGGFLDAWLGESERLCTGFGERPAGVSCPLAVFARPFGRKHVAVVQVSDQGSDDAGRPGALAFRILVIPARLYADLASDPFWISDQLPPPWSARGEMEAITWSGGPPPRRLVADLRKVLDVEEERTQTLLGGTQILVDGGRLVFVRPRPDERLLRDLWALLPYSTRQTIWPASFAFSNQHGFHVLVTPRADGPAFENYTREEQAGDYPEGQYEFSLQKAVEDGNQGEVDGLLARRSRSQMMKLAIGLLIAFALAALILNYPMGQRPADEGEKEKQVKKQDEPLKLPAVADVPSLNRDERKQLAARLDRLGKQVGAQPPAGDDEPTLAEAVAELDRRLDEKLGAKKPTRDPGSLDKLGPVKRRLMALLWKHGLPDYDQAGLNADEMLERLEKKLAKAGIVKEGGGE